MNALYYSCKQAEEKQHPPFIKWIKNQKKKIKVIHEHWSLSLVCACLYLNPALPALRRDREAPLQKAACCHSLDQGWQRSARSGGSREGKRAPGLTGVLAEGPEQVPHFLLLLLFLSALSVCAADVHRKSQTNSDTFPYSGWAKSEKALTAAFVEGLQYRLIL